jgi:uncharacterized membrane protein YkgB
MSRRKMLFQRVLPVAVSLAVLAFLFRSVDFGGVMAALNWRVVAVLAPALLVYGVITLALEAASITLLMSSKPDDFGLWTAARIKCASYLIGIVNFALGAGALTVLLRRRAGLNLAECASVVLTITSVDLVILMVMAAAGALVDAGPTGVNAGLFVLLVIAFVVGMTVLRMPANLGPIERLRSLTIFEALRTTPLPLLARLAALRVLFTSSFIALGGAAFSAFDIAIPLSDLTIGMVFVGVVSALPIAIAGLGTGQAAVVAVFGHLADREALLALSLVLTAGMIALRAGMGLLMAREFTREALEEARTAEA